MKRVAVCAILPRTTKSFRFVRAYFKEEFELESQYSDFEISVVKFSLNTP